MRLKKINKTQFNVLELLVSRPPSNLKKGYTFTTSGEYPMMSIQNGSWINALGGLLDSFPDIVRGEYPSFGLMHLFLLDDEKARKLLDYNLDWHGGIQ